jgi:hypothetical protein
MVPLPVFHLITYTSIYKMSESVAGTVSRNTSTIQTTVSGRSPGRGASGRSGRGNSRNNRGNNRGARPNTTKADRHKQTNEVHHPPPQLHKDPYPPSSVQILLHKQPKEQHHLYRYLQRPFPEATAYYTNPSRVSTVKQVATLQTIAPLLCL